MWLLGYNDATIMGDSPLPVGDTECFPAGDIFIVYDVHPRMLMKLYGS